MSENKILDTMWDDNPIDITQEANFIWSIANKLLAKYNKNIFSVMEEVWASDTERIDLVVFLNGFAIMSFELKCNFAGQSYQDAILQYRTQRNPKTRLFYFKAGCIVNFAMDLQEVYMTTRLANDGTFFLPFNMGSGNGIDAGKGNPVYPDKYSVYYMWERSEEKAKLQATISATPKHLT